MIPALREIFTRQIRFGSETGPFDVSGTGTPEGVVTAPVGSIFRRTDGGANTTVYRKESGAGNTGWVAVSNAGGGGGSVNAGVAALDFGSDGEDATVVVTGQATIAAGAKILVSVSAEATAENTIDEIFVDPPIVLAGNVTPGTGFSIYGRALEGSLHGNINVNWSWSP
jgi:hypothetical protein